MKIDSIHKFLAENKFVCDYMDNFPRLRHSRAHPSGSPSRLRKGLRFNFSISSFVVSTSMYGFAWQIVRTARLFPALKIGNWFLGSISILGGSIMICIISVLYIFLKRDIYKVLLRRFWIVVTYDRNNIVFPYVRTNTQRCRSLLQWIGLRAGCCLRNMNLNFVRPIEVLRLTSKPQQGNCFIQEVPLSNKQGCRQTLQPDCIPNTFWNR